jgi:zinc protease
MSNSHSLPGADDITRGVLSNGITFLVRSNFNSPTVTFSGYISTGSLFDTDEKLGLADFATSSLLRGTQSHSFEQIYDALESVGAHLGFAAGTHSSGFSGRALVEDLPLLFDLLADGLRNPAYPADEIERLRAQILTGLALRAQDTGDMASMAFDKMIFGTHPYARPDDGYPETIRNIHREDLAAYHERCFGPRGMTIAVVGAVDAQTIQDQLNRVLGDWRNPNQPELPAMPQVLPLTESQRQHIPLQGKSQTDLMVGSLGLLRKDPDFLPALLGNSILGQFGMMGRIGNVVREQSGLAYYASSSLSAGIGPGTWEVSAGVNPVNVEKALNLIVEQIRLFVEKGVEPEELQDSQDNFVGRLPLSLESNSGVANALINIERHGLGLDYYRHYEDMVRAVTPEMVQTTARKYLNPAVLAIATSGP